MVSELCTSSFPKLIYCNLFFSVVIHTGVCPPESSDSSVAVALSTSGLQHQEVDKGKSPQCKKSSTKRPHPQRHLQAHSGKTSSHCSDSDAGFSSVSSYQCPECKKRFSSNAGLQKHMRIHSGERPFQCSQCDKSFIKSSNLYQHLPVHSGEKPHHCSDCGLTFSTVQALKKHRQLQCQEISHGDIRS